MFCPTGRRVTNRQSHPRVAGPPVRAGCLELTSSPGPQGRVKPSTGFDHGTLWPEAWGRQEETGLGWTPGEPGSPASSRSGKQTPESCQHVRRPEEARHREGRSPALTRTSPPSARAQPVVSSS